MYFVTLIQFQKIGNKNFQAQFAWKRDKRGHSEIKFLNNVLKKQK